VQRPFTCGSTCAIQSLWFSGLHSHTRHTYVHKLSLSSLLLCQLFRMTAAQILVGPCDQRSLLPSVRYLL
jgi:hypothetical protein